MPLEDQQERKIFYFWQDEQMTCTVESWFSSLSQPFSAVIQSRAGEAQQDLKNEETQAQGLLSDPTLTLPVPQLQEDATDARQSKDCLQALDKDDLAQQLGGLAIKPRGKRGSWGTALICEYRFLDSSWHGLCQSGPEWSARSSNTNPEQGTWSPPGHYTVLLVGPSMAVHKCCQKLLRDSCNFSKSGCRDLELSCDRGKQCYAWSPIHPIKSALA